MYLLAFSSETASTLGLNYTEKSVIQIQRALTEVTLSCVIAPLKAFYSHALTKVHGFRAH